MALSIGVRVGNRIKITFPNKDEYFLKVVGTLLPSLVMVTVNGGEKKLITDQSRTEILPGVFVFSGGDGEKTHRLAFEAPKEIRIGRI